MQTICRLIQLSPDDDATLVVNPGSLADVVGSAKIYSDVYRYWHAIEFLLAKHRPDGAAARWLEMGTKVPAISADLPTSRVLSAGQVQEIDAELRHIEPDDLIPHYEASAMDVAQIYPATWQEWEEDFDPLGQVLEHYSFLQQFTSQCVEANAAMLLHFEFLAEGTV